MCHIYVLRSLKNQKRYVGSMSQFVEERLKQHNAGSNAWTRGNRPFELVYVEKFSSMSDARRRERFLKSGQGRQALNGILLKLAVQKDSKREIIY